MAELVMIGVMSLCVYFTMYNYRKDAQADLMKIVVLLYDLGYLTFCILTKEKVASNL